MAVAVYLRVSSAKGQETRSQEPDLQTWAKAQPEEVVWHRDRFTGTTMERPGLERLLADVRSGKVSKVCVWRLDRLGRTAKGLLTLLEELQVLGIGFVSLREGFDLSTPAGRLMAGVLASVAAYETEVRKERQLAGIAKAKSEGKTWGGRRTGTRVRLTEEKEAVIRQLHEQGKPVASIARTVGLNPQDRLPGAGPSHGDRVKSGLNKHTRHHVSLPTPCEQTSKGQRLFADRVRAKRAKSLPHPLLVCSQPLPTPHLTLCSFARFARNAGPNQPRRTLLALLASVTARG